MGEGAAKICGYILCVIFLIGSSQAYPAQQKGKKAIPEVCSYVVEHANRGELEKILIKPIAAEKELPASVIARLKDFDGAEVYLLDINNDEKNEFVLIHYSGSLRISGMDFYSEDGSSIEVSFSISSFDDGDDEMSGFERSLLQYDGKAFYLTRVGNSLNALYHIGPDNKGVAVCQFAQKEKTRQLIERSTNDTLCRLALSGKLEYVSFDETLLLPDEEPLEAGRYRAYHDSDAAFVDIDNDGNKEMIVNSENATNCSFQYLTVLDLDGKTINEKLSDRLPHGPCGSVAKPFVYEGKTYIDVVNSSKNAEYRSVVLVDRMSEQEVCTFDVKPVNYATDVATWIANNALAAEKNPWIYAISDKKSKGLVEALIVSGRNVNEHVGDEKFTPLSLAIIAEDEGIVELLLKSGANPNMRSRLWTPLEEAVHREKPRLVELLLKYGAQDTKNGSAVSAVLRPEKTEILLMLLRAGFLPSDNTVVDLVQGARKEAPAQLRLLIAYGLDVNRPYTSDVVVSGIEPKAPGVVSVGPDIKMQAKTKTLVKWIMEFYGHDVVTLFGEKRSAGEMKVIYDELLKIIRETQAKPPVASVIAKLRGADADLNKAYKVQTEALSKGSRDKLRKEQRTWIENRDTQCQSALPKSGMEEWLRFVAADEKRAQCVFEMTKKRTAELSAGVSTGK